MGYRIEQPESEYMKKLRDPRWQRKRLEIMQRDNFACRKCHEMTKTLHVHHTHYIGGRDPWDYPDDSLMTLCEQCHEEESEFGLPPISAYK
jgi:5-methylcytosine-specific restriction endonuclease McrA